VGSLLTHGYHWVGATRRGAALRTESYRVVQSFQIKHITWVPHHTEALALVQRLREAGQRTDFPLAAVKVGKQFQIAEQLGARWAVLVGDEWPQVKLKTLATREEVLVSPEELVGRLG
jgi:histidyl-tRNA synthetase